MYRGKIDRARRRETTAILEIYKWTHFLRLINNYLPKIPTISKCGFISGVGCSQPRFLMWKEKENGKWLNEGKRKVTE